MASAPAGERGEVPGRGEVRAKGGAVTGVVSTGSRRWVGGVGSGGGGVEGGGTNPSGPGSWSCRRSAQRGRKAGSRPADPCYPGFSAGLDFEAGPSTPPSSPASPVPLGEREARVPDPGASAPSAALQVSLSPA